MSFMRLADIETKLDLDCIERGFPSLKDALEEWYTRQEESCQTIAHRLDCSTNSLYKLLKKYGIQVRSPRSGSQAWRKDMGKHFK